MAPLPENFKAGHAAELEVLTKLDDFGLHERFEGAFTLGEREGCRKVVDAGAGRGADEIGHEGLEAFVLGDEVGLAVDLGEDAGLGAVVEGCVNEAFLGVAAGFLRGFRNTLLTEPFGGGFDVSVVFREGFLAVHHPRAGHVAEFFYE